MTTETRQVAPPAPAAPYAPAWMLYVYGVRAFLTFDGKIVATAPCATPVQEDRLIALFDRLTARTSRRYR